jgi:hypothetical protein
VARASAPGTLLPDARPRPSAQCAWQVVEGEAVLLDLEGRRILGLNPAGSYVWGLLDGRRTPAELAVAVAEHFRVGAERARADVDAFLADLLGRGLLEK